MTISNLSIIIPVFNGWEQTERCLRSLERSTLKAFTVIVVDHGSTDATKTQLPRLFPKVVHLVESPELWWTGATNAGIRHALELGATRIVLLNNDCQVEEEALARLVEHAYAEPNAVMAPVQRSIETGHVLSAGAVPCVCLGFPTLTERRTVPDSDSLIDARLLMGGRGLLIPRPVFDRIGFFDEASLPHYLADHDFYLRCRKARISLKVAPDATVLVDETRTSVAADLSAMSWPEFRASLHNPRSHRNLPSLRAFFRKHYPIRSLWWVGVWLNVTRYSIMWAFARATRLLKGNVRS